jgi:hypothetical protein
MKLTHRFAQLTPEKRPQDPKRDGTVRQQIATRARRATAAFEPFVRERERERAGIAAVALEP